MNKLWQELKPGDRIRVVTLPPEFDTPEYHLDADTRSLYDWVIASGVILVIDHVDEDGLPWVEFTRQAGDETEFHYLALNHGGIEIVSETGGCV